MEKRERRGVVVIIMLLYSFHTISTLTSLYVDSPFKAELFQENFHHKMHNYQSEI